MGQTRQPHGISTSGQEHAVTLIALIPASPDILQAVVPQHHGSEFQRYSGDRLCGRAFDLLP
jgi:hypothetical protein